MYELCVSSFDVRVFLVRPSCSLAITSRVHLPLVRRRSVGLLVSYGAAKIYISESQKCVTRFFSSIPLVGHSTWGPLAIGPTPVRLAIR